MVMVIKKMINRLNECSNCLESKFSMTHLKLRTVPEYSRLTQKFRIKILIPILFNISFLLDVQANLPETSPFLSAEVALMSTIFEVIIVLWMYNFGCDLCAL